MCWQDNDNHIGNILSIESQFVCYNMIRTDCWPILYFAIVCLIITVHFTCYIYNVLLIYFFFIPEFSILPWLLFVRCVRHDGGRVSTTINIHQRHHHSSSSFSSASSINNVPLSHLCHPGPHPPCVSTAAIVSVYITSSTTINIQRLQSLPVSSTDYYTSPM